MLEAFKKALLRESCVGNKELMVRETAKNPASGQVSRALRDVYGVGWWSRMPGETAYGEAQGLNSESWAKLLRLMEIRSPSMAAEVKG